MAVSYKRLFHALIDLNMSSTELANKAGITLNVISRLKKDQYVSLESIDKICNAINCDASDILEFIHPEEDEYAICEIDEQ